jgi:hypothetical protein
LSVTVRNLAVDTGGQVVVLVSVAACEVDGEAPGVQDAGEAQAAQGVFLPVLQLGCHVRVAIVATATSAPPHPEATWSHPDHRRAGRGHLLRAGLHSQVGRILAGLDLKPFGPYNARHTGDARGLPVRYGT